MTYTNVCFAYTGSMFWKVVFGLGETHISNKRAPRAGNVHVLFQDKSENTVNKKKKIT